MRKSADRLVNSGCHQLDGVLGWAMSLARSICATRPTSPPALGIAAAGLDCRAGFAARRPQSPPGNARLTAPPRARPPDFLNRAPSPSGTACLPVYIFPTTPSHSVQPNERGRVPSEDRRVARLGQELPEFPSLWPPIRFRRGLIGTAVVLFFAVFAMLLGPGYPPSKLAPSF